MISLLATRRAKTNPLSGNIKYHLQCSLLYVSKNRKIGLTGIYGKGKTNLREIVKYNIKYTRQVQLHLNFTIEVEAYLRNPNPPITSKVKACVQY